MSILTGVNKYLGENVIPQPNYYDMMQKLAKAKEAVIELISNYPERTKDVFDIVNQGLIEFGKRLDARYCLVQQIYLKLPQKERDEVLEAFSKANLKDTVEELRELNQIQRTKVKIIKKKTK